jgi:hypothetical protein
MVDINAASPSLVSEWAIFLPSALYFIHWFLVKRFDGRPRGVNSEAGLKYVWNVILLLLFIPAGLFGLLLSLGIKTPFIFYWHIQGGAAFVVICFTHLLNHLTYYLKGWKVFKQDLCE